MELQTRIRCGGAVSESGSARFCDFDRDSRIIHLDITMAQIAKWQIAKWFERKFDFSFPIELYPDLCMRLRGTPARLEELVGGRSRERMVRTKSSPKQGSDGASAEGTWSAQEHVGHLVELEPLWMARVEDFVSGRNELSVADLSNRSTFEARYNERAIAKILADFRQARTALVERVEGIDAALFGRTLLHPRLKAPMRLVDHLFFVAEHDDHHLAIIWEMVR
jgi:uncharacterized damage-inducible protein DinB